MEQIIQMYVCGPTVYDSSHIGHARTYIMVDTINRILTDILCRDTHLVMNITDIDDKIIKRSTETGIDWRQVAQTYEKSFFVSMAKLNVRLPDVVIRVSEVMDRIVQYIQTIIDNGFAYVSGGSVYFDSEAYVREGYPLENLVDEDESQYQSELSPLIILQKKNKKDFALWKGREKTEVGFAVTFNYLGETINSWGRPGWHIECSTMIHETIGPHLDIHFGGADLKFPHHHNERLQAHAYYHPMFKPDVEIGASYESKVWSTQFMHIGRLNVKGLKMSKSLKNFITVDEALQTMSNNQLRWMFIIHKWSEPMEFNEHTVAEAQSHDEIVRNFANKITHYPFGPYIQYKHKEFELAQFFKQTKKEIIIMLETYELEKVTVSIMNLISKTNAYLNQDLANECLIKKISLWLFDLLKKLGFDYDDQHKTGNIDDLMSVLIETRSAFRKLSRDNTINKETRDKIYQILDTERNVKLPEIGISLLDTKDSSYWHWLKS